jgi:hypothetical protein
MREATAAAPSIHGHLHGPWAHADMDRVRGQVSRWRIRVERHKGAVVVGCLVEPPAPVPGFARALVIRPPLLSPKPSLLSSRPICAVWLLLRAVLL